ncbi:flagellar hook assembly protein FlgD [Candidatus Sumerlaeota bacterium]|nr:flagellar hook assembly protein FlgD [Candidatus Sumerlaeota bacterium]
MSSTVQAIDSLASAETSPYTTTSNELGSTEFLSLLITQLQYQDPLDPQDPTEFTAQLAQFSSLEQLTNLNDAVLNLQLLQVSANNTMATNLIGKDVLYEGATLEIESGTPAEIRFSAAYGVENLTVTIKNANGTVVRTIGLGEYTSGAHTVAWDGNDGNGNALADGDYSVSFTGTDTDGNTVEIVPLTLGRVGGVTFENGVAYLEIAGERVALSDIFSVLAAE